MNNNNNNRAIELSKILKDEQEWIRTRKESQSTLIIVSLELPVKVVRLEKMEFNNEIDHANNNDKKRLRFELKSSQHSLMRTLHGHRNELSKTVKFIGWPGIHIEKEDEKEEIRELLEGIDCIPVFPPENEFKSFNEFCQLFLWPLFHNVLNPEELSNAPFDHEEWRRYHQMNMLWSSVITPIVSPEHMDMVWIHDYHLLLLCQYLTRRVKGVNIGLFLHIPFPSFEIFRCLPVREELLRSILMADLIGFHFFPYAKQFLSSCKRLLGLDHYFKPGGLIGIDKTTASSSRSVKSNNSLDPELNKQETIVRIGHVHIQCNDILQSIASNHEILRRSQEIRNKYKNHYIFVSIDRLDQLSGLQLKLKAFDNFLQNYPYIKEEQPVVLIQYIFPTNTLTLEKRDRLIQSLIDLSNEINQKHSKYSESLGKPVIELKYGSITQEEKYSLFLSGDCLFDTSVRDGLNLNPFEYIICKDDSLSLLNPNSFKNNGNKITGNGFSDTPSSSSSGNSSSSSSSEYGESSGNDDRIMRKTRTIGDKTVISGPFCRLKGQNSLPSLIISEFTGCSNTLSSPYRINPWNMMNVVETLDKTVYCQKGIFQEKRHHWNLDKAYLLSHSTVNWAKEFIMDLYIFSERKKNEMLHFYNTTFGIGPSLMDFRINLNSQHLSLNLLSQVYKKVDKAGGLKLFLLDNEGTLTPDFRHFFDKINSSSNFYSSSGFGPEVGTGAVFRARARAGVGAGNGSLSPSTGTSQEKRKESHEEKSEKNNKSVLGMSPIHSECCSGDAGFNIGKQVEGTTEHAPVTFTPKMIKSNSKDAGISLEENSSSSIVQVSSNSPVSPSSTPLSCQSSEYATFNNNSNCTSIEALNLENTFSNTSISSIINNNVPIASPRIVNEEKDRCVEIRKSMDENNTSRIQSINERKCSPDCHNVMNNGQICDGKSKNGEEDEHKLEDFYLLNEISCAPPPQVIEALKNLSSSPNNIIIIFSGRERHLLDEWFGDIDNIGLCAEHGYYLKLPKSIDPIHPNVWRQLNIESSTEDRHSSSSSSSSSSSATCSSSSSSASFSSSPSSFYSSSLSFSSSFSSPSVMYSVKKSNESENDLYGPLKASFDLDLGKYKEVGDKKTDSVLLLPEKQQKFQQKQQQQQQQQQQLHCNVSNWKNITFQLMEQYVLRTQGSYIENKGTALVFQFKYCEPYFGAWQAKELSNYLSELLINFPVNVISGNDFVEVRLQGINKGVAVQAILNQINSLSRNNNYENKNEDDDLTKNNAGQSLSSSPLEMILCIGDDRSDEDMFSVVNHFSKSINSKQNTEQSSDCKSPKCEIFNVIIGKHTSLANYFLYSTEEVSDILQTLTLFT
ncbi:Glycosyltransferase family 20 family protein [Cryptosporidium meleagridis]|uniref:Glycosyltransferase family 20 family protein n=1 Tax=Cryptosporidium meleagridis TaxID=93969 RepID=A0A2P4Z0A7_9CRYT|nr:Glycosyltransferase family 20 family protein [Cryptosporidium meleagridis]